MEDTGYRINVDVQAVGGHTITCLTCGRTSYSPYDVEFRYCGVCHCFHEDVAELEAREAWSLIRKLVYQGPQSLTDAEVHRIRRGVGLSQPPPRKDMV